MGLAAPAGRGRPGRQRLHAGCATSSRRVGWGVRGHVAQWRPQTRGLLGCGGIELRPFPTHTCFRRPRCLHHEPVTGPQRSQERDRLSDERRIVVGAHAPQLGLSLCGREPVGHTLACGLCGRPACRCHTDPEARHGPYHYWTRKARGKTVGLKLTEDELGLYREWIDNNRELERLVKEMRLS